MCIHAFKRYTLLLYHCVNSSLKLGTLTFILNEDFHFVTTKVPGPPWLITWGEKNNPSPLNKVLLSQNQNFPREFAKFVRVRILFACFVVVILFYVFICLLPLSLKE